MAKRPRVIADAGPLMVLAKLNVLPLLKRLYGTVLISQTVYEEVVTEGLAKGVSGRWGSRALLGTAGVEPRSRQARKNPRGFAGGPVGSWGEGEYPPSSSGQGDSPAGGRGSGP